MMEYEGEIFKKMEQSLYCPLCSLVEEVEFDTLADLQYDVTHRHEVREAVAEEGGFCDYHFRQFRKIASAKTNALLLIAMLERFAQPEMHFVVSCRFCSHLDEYEGRLIEAFSHMLTDSSFQVRYADHNGLCKRHLKSVRVLVSNEITRGWLVEVHRSQMLKEIPFLEQIATKSYYDASRLARGSISRTVEKFVGRRG
jgi:sarcosine oxidase delta subunit